MEKSHTIKIDQVIRSRRRTVAIIVEPDGRVTVRAPQHASQASLQAFVNEKAGWIIAKQSQVRAMAAELAPRQFQTGEKFWYLGQEIPLILVDRNRPVLVLERVFKLARASQLEGKKIFTGWYRRQARGLLSERVNQLAPRMGHAPPPIRITSARTRWGSCSSRGNLNFTWRLIMAPLPVIDYVVIHELTHLKIPNHSARFWEALSAAYPAYREQRAWLKENGHRLHL